MPQHAPTAPLLRPYALAPDLREELLATNRAISQLLAGSGPRVPAAMQLEAIDPSFLAALPPDMQAEAGPDTVACYSFVKLDFKPCVTVCRHFSQNPPKSYISNLEEDWFNPMFSQKLSWQTGIM